MTPGVITINVAIVILFVWIWYILFFKKPINTGWRECTMHCGNIYPQHGISPSVYTCPECGENTDYGVYRYVDGELEAKARK